MRKIFPQTLNLKLQISTGFSLIETIVYAALISIIIGMILFAVFQIIESQDRARSKIETEEEANFLMGKIKWALIGAQTINQPAVNSTSSILSLNKYNYQQNPLIFALATSAIQFSQSSGSLTIINSGSVRITRLDFYHQAASGTAPAALKTTLSVEFNPRGAYRIYESSTTLETTIFLRK